MKRLLILFLLVNFILCGIPISGFCSEEYDKNTYIEFLDTSLQIKNNRGNISYELAAYEVTASAAKVMEQRGMNVEKGLLEALNAEVKSYQVYKDSLNIAQEKMAKARIAAETGWFEIYIASRLGGWNSNYKDVSKQKRSALGIYKISQEMFNNQDKKEVSKFFENVQTGIYN